MKTVHIEAVVFAADTATDSTQCDTCHRNITDNIVEVVYKSAFTLRRVGPIDWLCEACAEGLNYDTITSV